MSEKQHSYEGKSLKGFAKGWVIFFIVYASAFGVSLLRYLNEPSVAGIAMIMALFAAMMVTGLALLLKKKAYGLWILLAGSALITAMSGAQSGGYIVFSSGGLVLVLVTWLSTRRQIQYGRRKTETAGEAQGRAAFPPAAAAAPRQPAQAAQPPKKASAAQPRRARKPSGLIIAGIAVFAVVVAGLLLLAFVRPHSGNVPGGAAADTGSNVPATADAAAPGPAMPSSSAQPQPMTAQQRALLDELSQKLPDVLTEMAGQIRRDKPFLSAMTQAKLGECSFHDGLLDVTVLLPDPRSESLDQLGLAPYAPHSDAQAYIRESYAKLCDMGKITASVPYEVSIPLERDSGGKPALDWTLQIMTGVPYGYEQVFSPHLAEYMQDRGFCTAAREILLPDFQNWDRHVGAEHGAALDGYYESLAGALSFDGITVDRGTVTDRDKILQTLKSRFANTWAFDSATIRQEALQTALSVRTIEPIAVFQRVYDELNAQYQSGSLPVPADIGALETAYLEKSRRIVNALYGDAGIQGEDAAVSREYAFSWEELGEKGIAACPALVSDIRQFLFNYDFELLFLADWVGVRHGGQ